MAARLAQYRRIRDPLTWSLAIAIGMVDATASGFQPLRAWWFAAALVGPLLGGILWVIGVLIRRPLPGAVVALIWAAWSLTVQVLHL